MLIDAERAGDLEGAISVASIAELHFGVSKATDSGERARRIQRLGVIESTFGPIPIDSAIGREWGRLAAAVVEHGGQPRRRALDLLIASTANVQGVPLLTLNISDFKIIEDLVTVRSPDQITASAAPRGR